jgi:hypothetical protein
MCHNSINRVLMMPDLIDAKVGSHKFSGNIASNIAGDIAGDIAVDIFGNIARKCHKTLSGHNIIIIF